ncbi:flavin reductase family protein [Polynucleobacter sinensis]|jgi:flavin reductase (DIM6/NTAB) family NADH-FMN oxidoreductase RutF|uniref:flavin reductase family protein n=1 Tax=Polynucleobacter sinensis TaxID=1743157 RepID=UPI0007803A5D|nr:flavin reductase family protein [Polynucleobacter sinensis]
MSIEVCGDKFDSRELRNVLGCFGTGVTVVTTVANSGERIGLTANSFSSVSLDPPIVLWSLGKQSRNLSVFQESGRFVINVLGVDQLHLSNQFAKPSDDRFAGVEHSAGLGGLPVIHGCAANIECETLSAQEVGDHILFLGKIVRYSYLKKDTLLFCNGAYAKAIEV